MAETATIHDKLNRLEEYLRVLGSVAVAYSGGVDSTFLIAVAHKVLGDRAIAVTARDASVPEREMAEAIRFCEERGIRHYIVETNPLEIEEYRNNDRNRCYFCKKCTFGTIGKEAARHGIAYIAEGSNMDDLGDYRPGLKAVSELEVKSPLREAALYKSEIRALAKEMELPVWDKPAAACLASRFAYGETITAEKLHRVDRAEELLGELGFVQKRVRVHGTLARIEVMPEDIVRLASDEIRNLVYDRLKELGFTYVSIDMKGYRTGSMNAMLEKKA